MGRTKTYLKSRIVTSRGSSKSANNIASQNLLRGSEVAHSSFNRQICKLSEHFQIILSLSKMLMKQIEDAMRRRQCKVGDDSTNELAKLNEWKRLKSHFAINFSLFLSYGTLITEKNINAVV